MAGNRDSREIQETAAHWLVRRDHGLTSAEEVELAGWLEADARHRAAFDALGETWSMLGELPADAAAPARAGAPAPAAKRPLTLAFPVALGAAAAVVLALSAVWRPPAKIETQPGPYTLAATTEVGGLRRVELPDGSVVQLNTDSAMEVRFDAAERRVRLTRGEAHFTVASNRGRPFIVSARGVDVRVVGTVFNVRLGSESVDVLVTEGKVRVGATDDHRSGASAPPAAPLASELTAGQRLSIAHSAPAALPIPAPVSVSPQGIRQALAWQARRLDFEAAPLAEIVAEINRYNRHQLVIADPSLATQRFGGSFPADDFTTVVRMLESNFNVAAERREGETRLRLRRP